MKKHKLEVPHGQKTIKLKITFFTNNCEVCDRPLEGDKTAWDSGNVTPITNRPRGIKSNDATTKFFMNFDELLPAIKQTLRKAGISIIGYEGKGDNHKHVQISLE